MNVAYIISVLALALDSASFFFALPQQKKAPKNYKLPLINEIRHNVDLLDDFFEAKPKKKTREDFMRIHSKLKKDKYNKLLDEYIDLKWTFGKNRTKFKKEPLYESIQIFYYKIEELGDLIDSSEIRPFPRLQNICNRGHDILATIDKK
ncbi:MAG: hypothetical protein WCY21_03150 [Candidatus Cloacimonadaceae bacterium]|jgi:hypothetical protein|nr:hypothetical protein [Candidatus Cloacimonadota bacterium]MDX9949377.1 hypothetical protein [Candidatus Syntrophosphaera sp.]